MILVDDFRSDVFLPPRNSEAGYELVNHYQADH